MYALYVIFILILEGFDVQDAVSLFGVSAVEKSLAALLAEFSAVSRRTDKHSANKSSPTIYMNIQIWIKMEIEISVNHYTELI